ncbi:mandelate racemase/muconate lactonizing enzyme family protein [Roseovarius faecimaris]|uniref:Mandelate racemase/muconate lactonizing enzyme family protein n=1 Tax=Roseovarius faecimaris TaxID=2494550 RepID=A0A6I6J3T5_9RHOB|nr:mandelate racemase/muconate lactonizing enzyme family protein [Roseovarius faecimaris]QGX99438.1 mandelate racemase/muconate lactonizing enzyme family protein [Roseovarius faecimaris]
MRIVAVTPYLIPARPGADGWSQGHSVILVRLEAANGLIGWGEAYALEHRQRAIREVILTLGGAVTEMSEASPRRFLDHVARPMESKHPGIDYAAAVSAIEIALWDLAGKAAGLPLHALLGGAVKERIPLYANAWDNPVQPPEAIAARCGAMCREGYRAVKIYPLRQATLAASEAVVRLTREAVGPEVDLMLDFAVETDPRRALQAARLFAPYAPYWIEEPVAGDQIDLLAEFRARTDQRVTTGERQAGLPHYNALLRARAADVLNPDIAGVGGLLRMLEIGAMTQAAGAQLSPHNWNSTTVAFLAMLHVCAVLPNATYAELFYDYLPMGADYATCDYVIKDGFASLPASPGLGVEIDEDALARLGGVSV